MSRINRLALVVALVLCAGSVASAATYSWVGTTGDWSVSANWGGTVPDVGDSVILPTTGRVITLGASTPALDAFSVNGGWSANTTIQGTGILNLTGTMSVAVARGPYWDSGGFFINAPISSTGALNVTQGSLSLGGTNNSFAGPINLNPAGNGGDNVTLVATADRALGTATVNINGGTTGAALWITGAQTVAGGPIIATGANANVGLGNASTTPPAVGPVNVTINGGGVYARASMSAASTIILNPSGANLPKFGGWGDYGLGTGGFGSRNVSWDSPITLNGDAIFTGAGANTYGVFNLNANITGTGTIKYQSVTGIDWGYYLANLSKAGQTFAGNWAIEKGSLGVTADGALGTGSQTVIGGAGQAAGLYITAAQTGYMPNLVVKSQGYLRLNTAAAPYAITLDGGTLLGGSSGVVVSGTVTVLSASSIENTDVWTGGTTTISGHLVGSAPLTIKALANADGTWPGYVILSADNSATYSGPITAGLWTLQAKSVGALGTGTATAAKGGTIRSMVNNSLASASQVIAADGGMVDLNSIENNAKILIKAGGGFLVSPSGSGTILNYTPTTGNVNVEAGCILDANLAIRGGFPTGGQFLTGDGGYGAFLGQGGAFTGTKAFGSASGAPFRGFAALNGAPLTFSGTATETAGGSAGVGFLAQGSSSITYAGGTVTTDGTHTVKLYGAGVHTISGTANQFNNDLEMLGAGKVVIDTAGGLAGRQLSVSNGYLNTTISDALSGATVNIKSGGLYRVGNTNGPYGNTAAGRINVESGGAVALTGDNFNLATDLGGGADWNFAPGSQVVYTLGGMAGLSFAPADGKASYLIYSEGRADVGTYLPQVVLSDVTRMTQAPQNAAGYANSTTSYGPGPITLASGSTSGRLAAVGGTYLSVQNPISMSGQKLIIGDANPFRAAMLTGTGFANVSQNGIVNLTNTANVIGNIDIQAGTLSVSGPDRLGGAQNINLLGSNAKLHIDWGVAYTDRINGNGTLEMGAGQTFTVSPTTLPGVVLSPGLGTGTSATAGKLTVAGNLAFTAPTLISSPATVTLANATATYSRGMGPVSNALNPDAAGWDLWRDPGCNAETAAFETAPGTELTQSKLTIVINSLYGFGSVIGNFRLSVTTTDRTNFADGLANGGNVGTTDMWTVLTPLSVNSSAGTNLAIQPDGSVLAIQPGGGWPSNAPNDSYSIVVNKPSGTITGLRLEALEDPSLPDNGPGTSTQYAGYTVVSEIKVLDGVNVYARAQLPIKVLSSAGVAGVSHDQIAVTGNAGIGNADLVVNLPLPSGVLSLASPFSSTILTAGAVNGQFGNVTVSGSNSTWWDLTGAVTYTATSASLTIGRANWLPHDGDFNYDKQVNGDDLTTLANNWMATGANWSMGDFTMDGVVNGDDLTVLANHWGEDYTGAAAGAVPEPASLALLGLGALALIRRRRK